MHVLPLDITPAIQGSSEWLVNQTDSFSIRLIGKPCNKHPVWTSRLPPLIVKTESVPRMSLQSQWMCPQPRGQLDRHAAGMTWLSQGPQPELGTGADTWEKTAWAFRRHKTAIKSNHPYYGTIQNNGVFQCVNSKPWPLAVFYCH